MESTIIIFEIFEDCPRDADFGIGFISSFGTLRVHECDILEFLN